MYSLQLINGVAVLVFLIVSLTDVWNKGDF